MSDGLRMALLFGAAFVAVVAFFLWKWLKLVLWIAAAAIVGIAVAFHR